MELLSPTEAAAHKAAWPKGQEPWMAADPGENPLLTIELFTEEMVYLLKLGHGSLARLYPHQRELDRARSDRTWLVVELQRLEGGEGGKGGLAYKMQVEGLLEKTKVTKQREWHFMKAIQRKLHGTCVEILVALARTIILPDLDTPALGRKAGAKTARALAATGMRGFMKKLDARCAAMGIERRPTCEAYSTQGCSHCSFVNVNVKRRRVWCCPRCQTAHDRGGNSAGCIAEVALYEDAIRRFPEKGRPTRLGAAPPAHWRRCGGAGPPGEAAAGGDGGAPSPPPPPTTGGRRSGASRPRPVAEDGAGRGGDRGAEGMAAAGSRHRVVQGPPTPGGPSSISPAPSSWRSA